MEESEAEEHSRGNGVGTEKSQRSSCKRFSESWEGNESEEDRGDVWTCVTHSEPAAMSRYEVSAVSTPTGTTMLMTFSADQFLSY